MATRLGIFIDFENLIYGLVDRFGEQGAYELFKVQLIMEYASRYGEVNCAYAYADWRIKAVNQWQIDLYSRGVELVHVLGRGGKNAVDIRMAIDVVEHVFTQSSVDAYLIVSGDRDFLPLVNLLKRHGKKVIALSPSRAMSKEMRRVCEETSTYEGLLHESDVPANISSRLDVLDLLDEVMNLALRSDPEGLTGAQLKQLLLQSRDGAFQERDYGFISFGALLEQLVKLSKEKSETLYQGQSLSLLKPRQGDLRIEVSHGDQAYSSGEITLDLETHSPLEVQLALSCLRGYQYVPEAPRRREVLLALYEVLSPNEGVRWADALEEICKIAQLSRSQASKYHAILLQSQAFTPVTDADTQPVKHRRLKLIEALNSADALIFRYEQSILHKIISRRGHISVQLACDVLGLDIQEDAEYLNTLLEVATNEAVNDEAPLPPEHLERSTPLTPIGTLSEEEDHGTSLNN